MASKQVGNLAVSDKQADDNQGSQGKGTLASAVKKLISKGKERGFLTYDEINKTLPAEEFSSEQIEDAMATITDVGVQMVESEDDVSDTDGDGNKEEYDSGGNIAADDTGRTDDPVRMYLREMGQVELLSREGEIAIAKRIEAGREMMIGGLCESPLAIESLIAWYKALQDGEVLLREVIDLDATYNDDPVDQTSGDVSESDEAQEPVEDEKDSEDGEGDGESGEGDDENSISLAAMEEELAPQVYEIFGKIQKTYKKMQKVQHARLEALGKGKEPDAATNKKYNKLKEDMVVLMDEVRLNNARIEQLIDRLYGVNKHLVTMEGKLLRLATDVKVKREEFLEEYYGHELDPKWLTRVGKLKSKGWADFAKKHKDQIGSIRDEIGKVSEEAGLPIGEWRRIVSTVQKGEREARARRRKWWRRTCVS